MCLQIQIKFSYCIDKFLILQIFCLNLDEFILSNEGNQRVQIYNSVEVPADESFLQWVRSHLHWLTLF